MTNSLMNGVSDWLTSLPSPSGLLEKVQRDGRSSLSQLELPNRKQESWRFSAVDRLESIFSRPLQGSRSHGIDQPIPAAPSNGLRLHLDTDQNQLRSLTLPVGLSWLTEAEINTYLGSSLACFGSESDWLVELNHAATQHLLALRISGSPPPPELIMGNSCDGLSATRILLILEEKAELEILQIWRGEANTSQSHILEVQLGSDSSLHHGVLALGTGNSSFFAHLAVQQEPGSLYELTSALQGWHLARIEPRMIQSKGKAKTILNGLAMSDHDQEISMNSFMRFDGPDGEFDQLQKNLVSGHSHTVFNGAVSVPKVAQKTNASQLSRNLMLSPRARIDTKPELEIVADDVRCTHGATVSQLQEDQLFYLRSRGISEIEAAKLLLRGYCKEITSSLPVEAERWLPLDYLLNQLRS